MPVDGKLHHVALSYSSPSLPDLHIFSDLTPTHPTLSCCQGSMWFPPTTTTTRCLVVRVFPPTPPCLVVGVHVVPPPPLSCCQGSIWLPSTPHLHAVLWFPHPHPHCLVVRGPCGPPPPPPHTHTILSGAHVLPHPPLAVLLSESHVFYPTPPHTHTLSCCQGSVWFPHSCCLVVRGLCGSPTPAVLLSGVCVVPPLLLSCCQGSVWFPYSCCLVVRGPCGQSWKGHKNIAVCGHNWSISTWSVWP